MAAVGVGGRTVAEIFFRSLSEGKGLGCFDIAASLGEQFIEIRGWDSLWFLLGRVRESQAIDSPEG